MFFMLVGRILKCSLIKDMDISTNNLMYRQLPHDAEINPNID